MPASLTQPVPALSAGKIEAGSRLLALDALRGFDMFWIVGGDHLIRSLPKISDHWLAAWLAAQMEHVEFEGFHFYDLIFPLFVFMVGVAITFSIPRMVEQQGRGAALRRVAVRSALLFFLGVVYMGGVSGGFKNIYFAGVLQRIGVAYFFAALIYCFWRDWKRLAALAAFFLVGYWLVMTVMPVPGLNPRPGGGGFLPAFQLDFSHTSAPSYAQGKSLAYVLDQAFMPGKKFEGTILSTPAAVANALLGVLAGILLQAKQLVPWRKSRWLILAGTLSVELGYLWGRQFPIVKVLWTSSFVLVACGYSAVLLGVFHLLIDVWKWQRWAQPLVWIGTNAITIYLVSALVGFPNVAKRFVGGDIAIALGAWGDTVRAIVALSLMFLVCRFLYQRKLFLRL